MDGEELNPGGAASHTTTDRVAQAAHEAVDHIAARGSRAEERLRETGHHATERSREIVDEVTRYVNENPLTSVGIAVAVGFVLGTITRR